VVGKWLVIVLVLELVGIDVQVARQMIDKKYNPAMTAASAPQLLWCPSFSTKAFNNHPTHY
jgi:hypothetical protein